MKNLSNIPQPNCPHCGQLLVELEPLPLQPVGGLPSQPALSLRERQLVDLVRQAKSNKEIAFELSLTVGSVKEYMHRVFKKVGVRSRTELALWSAGQKSAPSSEVLS